jgi:hypothetical protein
LVYLRQGHAMQPKLASNSRSSFHCFLSAEITGMCHHTWLLWVFDHVCIIVEIALA